MRQIAANLLFLKVFIIVLDSTFGEFYKEVRKHDFSTLELLIGQIAHMTKSLAKKTRKLNQDHNEFKRHSNPSKWVQVKAKFRLLLIYLLSRMTSIGEFLTSKLKSSNKPVKVNGENEDSAQEYPKEIGRMIIGFQNTRLVNLLKETQRLRHCSSFRKLVLLDEKGRMEENEREEGSFLKYYNGLISYVNEKSKATERHRCGKDDQDTNNSLLLTISEIFLLKKFLRIRGIKDLFSRSLYIELLQEALKENQYKKKISRTAKPKGTRRKDFTSRKTVNKKNLEYHNPLQNDNQVLEKKSQKELSRMTQIDYIMALAFREDIICQSRIDVQNSNRQHLQAKQTEEYLKDDSRGSELEVELELDRIDQEDWNEIPLLLAYKYFERGDLKLVREIWAALPVEERIKFWSNEGLQICKIHHKFGIISAIGWTYKTDDEAVGTLRFTRLEDLCYFTIVMKQKNFDLVQVMKSFESEGNLSSEREGNDSGSIEESLSLKIKEEYQHKLSPSEFFDEVIEKSGVMKILSECKSIRERYHAIMSKSELSQK